MVSEWQIMCAEFLTQCWEKVPPIITSPCPLHTWLRRLDHCPYSDCMDVLRLFPRHSLDFAANYSCYKHSYDADIGEGNIEGEIYASFLEILFLSVCLPFSLSLSALVLLIVPEKNLLINFLNCIPEWSHDYNVSFIHSINMYRFSHWIICIMLRINLYWREDIIKKFIF